MFNLKGKTVLITGSSSGLGKEAARAFSVAGCRVLLLSRNQSKLDVLEKELENARAIPCDISCKTQVREAFDSLKNERIDILVNNAGIGTKTPIFENDNDNLFERIVQTNLMGVWYVTQAAAQHMKQNKIHGSIINISSVNGANKLKECISAYAASKAAVIQLTKALVKELAAYHIRINTIAPGLFHTPLTEYQLNNAERYKEMESLIPLGFVAKPKDLTGALLFLASNEASSYVTGSCLTVDGGISWGG